MAHENRRGVRSWPAHAAAAGLGPLAATWPGIALAAEPTVLERFGPLGGSLAFSFVAGFVLGKIARKTVRTAAVVAGIAALGIFLLGRYGIDGSGAAQWVDAGSAWVGENVEGGGRYLASLLPSAGAAAVGGFLGFRK